MKYLLDTDIISYLVRGNRLIANRMTQLGVQCSVSAITVMELLSWQSSNSKNQMLIAAVLKDLPVIDFGKESAALAGDIRRNLQSKGHPSSISDIMIAATAISNHMVLVTNNSKDFSSIENLALENWLK